MERRDCLIQVIIRDVRVEDEAEAVGGYGEAPDAFGVEVGLPLLGGAVGVDHHDVGLGGGGVGVDAGEVGEGFGDGAGAAVVFGEAVHHLGEADDAAGGQQTRLAHAAAEALSPELGLVDEGLRPAQERADGGAEALAEADGDGIERVRDGADIDAEGDGGVEGPRAIEVHGDAVAVGDFAVGV